MTVGFSRSTAGLVGSELRGRLAASDAAATVVALAAGVETQLGIPAPARRSVERITDSGDGPRPGRGHGSRCRWHADRDLALRLGRPARLVGSTWVRRAGRPVGLGRERGRDRDRDPGRPSHGSAGDGGGHAPSRRRMAGPLGAPRRGGSGAGRWRGGAARRRRIVPRNRPDPAQAREDTGRPDRRAARPAPHRGPTRRVVHGRHPSGCLGLLARPRLGRPERHVRGRDPGWHRGTVRLAWIVRVTTSGPLAERLAGLELAFDAGDGTPLGGDILE